MVHAVFFLLLILSPSLSSAQDIPNLEEIREITRMTAIVANVDNDPELLKALEKTAGNELCVVEEVEKPKRKTITKAKPKLSLFFKITAPTEDLKRDDLYVDPEQYMDELAPIIKAQSEAERNAAIKNLCATKSNLEKIQLGSTLFNKLGDVYNYGLVNNGIDQYSSQDPTKDPSNFKMITLQRQYNALNAEFYGGQGFPNVAGVCRHASTLVSDFLAQCGFDTKQISQVGYATKSAGHAVVKVTDPKTHKTYVLNWGEVSELSSSDGLTSFDVPSESIKSTGMLIYLYDPNEEGKLQEVTRTNKGVVMARLLNVADDKLDYTVYRTTEAGMVLDLGTKSVKYNRTGNTKEVNQEIALKMIDAQNVDYGGNSHSMTGVGVSYKRDAVKYFGNHVYWQNRLQTSIGQFSARDAYSDTSSTQTGYGITHIQGMSVGKMFEAPKSKTTVDVGSDFVGEFYTFTTSTPDSSTKKGTSMNGQGYFVSTIKLKQERGKDTYQVEAGNRLTVMPDMQYNTNQIKVKPTAYNPQFSAMYSRDLSEGKSTGATATYIGSVDRQFYKTDVFFKDEKKQLNASSGFMVVKSIDGQNFVYTVTKIDKNFDLNKLDLTAGVSAQKSLTTPAPVMIQATVRITPKLQRR